jgi:proteasome lid subunit RPN8/RPN11
MKKAKKVLFKREVINGLLAYAKSLHPEEAILLLRGKVKKDSIIITELVIPPLFERGENFASFPIHMLPLDLSILGTAHSHPNGFLQPSEQDLVSMYGRLMVIVSYPYESERDIAVFDKEGNRALFEIL